MKKYKGYVRETYEYEIEVEAEDAAEAIIKLKELYADDSDESDGIFLAQANTFLRVDFSLRRGKQN